MLNAQMNPSQTGTTQNDTFGYNSRSELVSATLGNDNYSYAFDAIGNRATSSEAGTALTYTANNLNQYTEICSAEPIQQTATRPLALQKDGTWFTYGYDITKNVCELFGPNGYIRTAYSYAPFGAVTESGDVSQPFQWSSEVYDSELDLVYYNYRHYSPSLGRFLSRDPIQEQGGWNLYAFVRNRPTFQDDSLGLISVGGGDGKKRFSGVINGPGYAFDWEMVWGLSFSYKNTNRPCEKEATGTFSLSAEAGITVGYGIRKNDVFGWDVFLLAGIRFFAGLEASTTFSVKFSEAEIPSYSSILKGVGYGGAEGGTIARISKAKKNDWKEFGLGLRGQVSIGSEVALSCVGEQCSVKGSLGLIEAKIDVIANILWFDVGFELWNPNAESLPLRYSDSTSFKNPLLAAVE